MGTDTVAAPPSQTPGKQTLVQRMHAAGGDAQVTGDAAVSAAARGVAGSGGPLPHRDRIQMLFGRHDIRNVTAHTGPEATEATRALGAEAYASDGKVAFAGTPSLHTAAHEAAHVVQQRGGVQLKGGVGAEGDAHEQHADRVADLVVAGQPAESLLDTYAPGATVAPGVQRLKNKYVSDIATYIASQNDKYFLEATEGNTFLFTAATAPAPLYCDYVGMVGAYKKYKPHARFPNDCLSAAEQIMHHIMSGKKPKANSTVSKETTSGMDFGDTEVGNWDAAQHATTVGTKVNPGLGHSYVTVEETQRDIGGGVMCQYHAAAVVAKDGPDNITLEVFGTPTGGTVAGKFCIYSSNPKSKYNFHTVVTNDTFPDGITISIEPK